MHISNQINRWLSLLWVFFCCFILLAPIKQASATTKRTYSWVDFCGTKRTVTFNIQSSDIEASIKEYGAPPDEMGPQQVTLSYKVTYPSTASPKEIRKLKERAKGDFERKAQAMLSAQRSQLLSHGYTTIGKDKVGVDLPSSWAHNKQRMRNYAAQFMQQTGIKTSMFPSHALAFVQQMEYGTPPDIRAGLCILQYFPPVEALSAGYGDCDTKAVLFASLVDDGTGPEVIALRGNDHVIAGLECEPNASGYVVKVFGKSFLLCECSAATWLPGQLSRDTYKAIERGEYTAIRLRLTNTY